jgi:hypothetical protein
LSAELLLGSIEGSPMVRSLTLGDQHLASRNMQPELRCLLDPIGVEYHRGLHGPLGNAPQALDDRNRPLSKGGGNFAMTGGDGRLHDHSSWSGFTPGPI